MISFDLLKRFLFFILTLAGICPALVAQTGEKTAGKAKLEERVSPMQTSLYQQGSHSEVQNLHIEDGKLWINGNLIPKTELPKSLQEINPNYRLQASLYGTNEFKFNLWGNDYLLKHGKIVEIAPSYPVRSEQTQGMIPSSLNTTDYFNNLRNETPDIFSSMMREAQLQEYAIQLLMDFEVASPAEKIILRKKLAETLGQLFDLSIQNQELEITQAEEDLRSVKKEVEFRKKNRNTIIENRLKQITGE